jgi:[acyl-carrier-protein] S-malonyltransferase
MVKAKQIAFLFPGQGAQYPGMGKDFYENFHEVQETFEEAEDSLGRNVSDIILHGPENILTQTRNSQTGIYIVSVALTRVIERLFPDLRPSFTAGLSLGEYSALFAGKWGSFEEILKVVERRGQYMNKACEEKAGTMAVILGLPATQVEQIVKDTHMPEDVWTANFNCPGQVVISGTIKGIEAASLLAKMRGAKRILPLQVQGAFHSGLMKSAEERLKLYIQTLPLRKGTADLVMNVTASITDQIDEVKQNLIKQVTEAVRWQASIEALQKREVDLFIEIGPGKTLSGFNKRIGVTAPTISIEKIDDLDLLAKSL